MSKKRGSHLETAGREIVREILDENLHIQHTTKSWAKRLFRYIKIAAWMLASAIVIPISFISMGILFGPRGYEGILITPVAVFSVWALILFIGLKKRITPKKIAAAKIADLPAKMADYLESTRTLIPSDALKDFDGILEHLDEVAPALRELPEEDKMGKRLRRLLADDLSVLIDHYQKVPHRIRMKPLHGGPSPKEQFSSGLKTIKSEIVRIHDEMAQDDLYLLATKQRYLELKYEKNSD